MHKMLICAALLFVSIWGGADDHMEDNDVRIIVDISGSMIKSDPSNLRIPALELLIELLPEDSQAGVWTFGKYVNLLIPHKPVNSQWRENARTQIKKINSLGQRTNIGGVLENAAYDFDFQSYKGKPQVILLTDGMVDISRSAEANAQERERILNRILPKYAQKNAVIHSIALSDVADKKLLDQLSLNTNGIAEVAKSSDELLAIFLKLFDQAVMSEQVPLDKDGFLIDRSVNEFTALIFSKDDIELLSPSGHVLSMEKTDRAVSWYKTDDYHLITVSRPSAGQWTINGTVEDMSRVTVVSDLSLQVDSINSNAFVGQSIDVTAWFDSKNGIIKDEAFLNVMDVNIIKKNNDNSNEANNLSVVRNGEKFVAQNVRFDEQGDYQIEVMVDGKTFQRKFNQTLKIRPAISTEIIPQFGQFELRIYPNHPDLKNIQLQAMVQKPDGTKESLAIELSDFGYWSTKIMPNAGNGQYIVELSASFDLGLENVDDLMFKPMVLRFPIMQQGASSELTSMNESKNMDSSNGMDAKGEDNSSQMPMNTGPVISMNYEKTEMLMFEMADVVAKPEPKTVENQSVNDEWGMDEPALEDDSSPTPWTLIIASSVIGLIGVVGFMFVYKRFESKNGVDGLELADQALTKEELSVLDDVDGKENESEDILAQAVEDEIPTLTPEKDESAVDNETKKAEEPEFDPTSFDDVDDFDVDVNDDMDDFDVSTDSSENSVESDDDDDFDIGDIGSLDADSFDDLDLDDDDNPFDEK